MCAHIAVPVQTSKGTPLPSFLKGVVDPVTVNVPEPFWEAFASLHHRKLQGWGSKW